MTIIHGEPQLYYVRERPGRSVQGASDSLENFCYYWTLAFSISALSYSLYQHTS